MLDIKLNIIFRSMVPVIFLFLFLYLCTYPTSTIDVSHYFSYSCVSVVATIATRQSFDSLKPKDISDADWNNCIFKDKISLVKDGYYKSKFPNDCCEANINGEKISMFGLTFVYDFYKEYYNILDKNYTSIELLCIADCFYRYFESINIYGFVNLESLNGNFISSFKDHLVSLGYERRLLGNSEITYSLWHNYIFLNIFVLLAKYLENLDGKESISYNETELEQAFELEVFEELSILKKKYFLRLDQYLKLKLGKRGISVIKNTYCSFDTEYQLQDSCKK